MKEQGESFLSLEENINLLKARIISLIIIGINIILEMCYVSSNCYYWEMSKYNTEEYGWTSRDIAVYY